MIVKIQRPVTSSKRYSPALIYSQDHSLFLMTPFTPELKRLMGNRAKIYVEVNNTDDNVLLIQGMKIVEDQSW